MSVGATALDIARRVAGSGIARIGVALSGGSDSMAVLHLLAEACAGTDASLHAVTVDHALRPGSVEEARFAADACARLRVPHDVRIWQHGAVRGNLMDAARQARYALMAEWAAAKGVGAVVLGHTADDQAETFLMGLGRAAGFDGLVGMRSRFDVDEVRFLRPFLGVEREALRQDLRRRGVAWIDDPSNADPRFARVRARTALMALQPLGISVAGIALTMAHLASERQGIREEAARIGALMTDVVVGEVRFDAEIWDRHGVQMKRRLLQEAVVWVARPVHPPRAASLSRVLEAVDAGQDSTLSGCRIRCGARGFRVVREPRAVAGLVSRPGAVWDGRWWLDTQAEAAFEGLEVKALSASGLRFCPNWRTTGASRDALMVSPALWSGDRLVAAPAAGLGEGWTARIVAPTRPFAVSH